VGKTTTLAKLTAQYALMMKKDVGIITCDTYRIAAVEQLKTYCEIMDVPVKVVYQPRDIMEAMEGYRGKDLILVDTAGRSHRDKMRLVELQNLLKNLGQQQIFLVISATTNYKNCLDILESYSFLEDYRVLITKIDENVTNGIILNLALKSGRPLSYITTGQNVPDDIEKVDGERVASLILSR
jgi:flagellar biosynthesis protein FlhF